MQAWRCGSGTFRMNVALSELPRFASLPEAGEHLSSGIVMAPSMAYMDRAWRDAIDHGMSRAPIVEMLIPSTVDDTLAPKGAHVASLFCQHFRYTLPDGRVWDDAARDAAADRVIATVERFAPGFKRSVLGRSALSPLDLERTFGLVGGDIMHGQMSLDQLWAARPMLGHGDYRSPIGGLYMCGAGTHPGGGVSGMPGYNAAREIGRDTNRLTALKLALAGH
jgi:phytoene dehydrogenase-like protein